MKQWKFNSDSNLFRLISEAYRMNVGYLFEPFLAVHSSRIESCRIKFPPSMKEC